MALAPYIGAKVRPILTDTSDPRVVVEAQITQERSDAKIEAWARIEAKKDLGSTPWVATIYRETFPPSTPDIGFKVPDQVTVTFRPKR